MRIILSFLVTPPRRAWKAENPLLPAQFTISAAIAHARFAQLFFVEASLPQFSAPCSSIVTPIALLIVAMVPRTHMDSSRPDLNVNLREGRCGKDKEGGRKYGQDTGAHNRLLRFTPAPAYHSGK